MDICTIPDNKENSILHLAIKHKLGITFIKSLVTSNPDLLKTLNKYKRLPLHCAMVYKSELEIVKLLVESYPESVTEVDNEGDTPLHCAIISESEYGVIKYLVEFNSDVLKMENDDDETPLNTELEDNPRDDVIRLLIDNSQMIDYHVLRTMIQNDLKLEFISLVLKKFPDVVYKKGKNGNNILHWIIINKPDFNLIKLIVDRDPMILYIQNKSKNTPLYLALWKKLNFDLIKYLVDPELNVVKVQNSKGYLPLHIAVRNELSDEIVEFLIKSYPDGLTVQKCDGDTPLHIAVQKRNLRLTKILVDYNPHVLRIKNNNGFTPINYGEMDNLDIDMITILAKTNPSVLEIPDHYGNIPLHNAIIYDADYNVIKLLAQLCPKVICIQNSKNETPLHCALNNEALQGDLLFNVIQLLIELNPGVLTIKGTMILLLKHFSRHSQIEFFLKTDPLKLIDLDNYGNTILHILIKNSSQQFIEMVIGINKKLLMVQNSWGETPLHCAINNGYISNDNIKQLVQYNPDIINIQDNNGNTPFHLVIQRVDDLGLGYKYCELFDFFLEQRELDMEIYNIYGKSPFDYVSNSMHLGKIRVLKFIKYMKKLNHVAETFILNEFDPYLFDYMDIIVKHLNNANICYEFHNRLNNTFNEFNRRKLNRSLSKQIVRRYLDFLGIDNNMILHLKGLTLSSQDPELIFYDMPYHLREFFGIYSVDHLLDRFKNLEAHWPSGVY